MKLIDKLYEQAEKVVGTKINNYLTIMSINYEYNEHNEYLDATIKFYNSYTNKMFSIFFERKFNNRDDAIILTYYAQIKNNFIQYLKIGLYTIFFNGHRAGYDYTYKNTELLFPSTYDDYSKDIILYTKQ